MEIEGLTEPLNQTPSETFREMCLKLACVNCGSFMNEGKITLAHQEETKGEVGVVVVGGDDMILSCPSEKLEMCPLPPPQPPTHI